MRLVGVIVLVHGCGRIGFDPLNTGSGDGGLPDGGLQSSCVADLAVGATHGCALLNDGRIFCYGENTYAELGTGVAGGFQPMPMQTVITPPATAIEAGGNVTCVLRNDRQAACFGHNNDLQVDGVTGTDPSLTAHVAATPALEAIRLGLNFSCGLSGETILCWGDGDEGQPGRGVDPDTHPPELVAASGFRTLALGSNHVCTTLTNTQIACWGDARAGRIGGSVGTICANATDGAIACALSPVSLTGILSAVGVTAGDQHTCAWTETGQVYCWGANDRSQCAQPQSAMSAVALVSGLPPIRQLAAGRLHTCALDTAGGVWCWGADTEGQLGAGSADSATPIMVMLGGPALAITSHSFADHTCAVLADGAACWGANTQGQQGRGVMGSVLPPGRVLLPCP